MKFKIFYKEVYISRYFGYLYYIRDQFEYPYIGTASPEVVLQKIDKKWFPVNFLIKKQSESITEWIFSHEIETDFDIHRYKKFIVNNDNYDILEYLYNESEDCTNIYVDYPIKIEENISEDEHDSVMNKYHNAKREWNEILEKQKEIERLKAELVKLDEKGKDILKNIGFKKWWQFWKSE